jgi:hypothetical protein
MPAPNPSGSNLHINAPLTNVSIGWYNGEENGFIADKVFPAVPGLQHQGNLYRKYKRGDWFRGEAAKRAPGTESEGGGWEVETDSYFADVWAVHKDVTDQDRANADSVWSLDKDAAEWVAQNLATKREKLFIQNFLTTGVWDTDITGVASAPGAGQTLRWDVAGSDPVAFIKRQKLLIKELTGVTPNKLVVGPYVDIALTEHAAIRDLIKYSQKAVITNDLLSGLFGVEYLVADAVENVGVQGAADDIGFQFGNDALLVYAAKSPGVNTISGGYIFPWAGYIGSSGTGHRTKKFRMEPIASDRVEGEMAFDMKVVAPELGVFFNEIVS